MSSVHFLNVGKGDCTLIRHNTGHNTLIDICKGNLVPLTELSTQELVKEAIAEALERTKGNFGMSKKPTNPITYLQSLGISNIFRFILTHPDMDHLDGFDSLLKEFTVTNFWHTGVTREAPEFTTGEYSEDDWITYLDVVAKKWPQITTLSNLAGAQFKYANQGDSPESSTDALQILSPNTELVREAIESGDVNDSSYVLLFRSAGGRILIPGDAHDETWDYVLKHYSKEVANCSVLFAPHHGRKSGRSFEFLNTVKPKITFFGCAAHGHLAYGSWSSRKLPVITNNQAGNIVLDCHDGRIDIFVENEAFATANDCDPTIKNDQGYVYFDSVLDS